MLSPGTHTANLGKAPVIEHVSKDSYFDFEGIRFTPRALVYQDVFEGETKELEFSIQNIKTDPVVVRIYPPNSCAFTLYHVSRQRLLPPGLKVTGVLSFTNRRHNVARLMIEIFINNVFVEYPVHVYLAAASMTIEPTCVDFGVVDVGASAVIRHVVLRNQGSVSCKFSIDLGSNELDLVVTPNRGIVRAHSEVVIRLEMVGIHEGTFYKEFWISGANRPLRCPVMACVILSKLIIYHPNTTGDFTLIEFDPTFGGMQRRQAMVVRNISSQTTTFVVLAEVNNELMTLEKVRETDPAYNMFNIEPSQGRMQPFEGRIFTLSFKPTGKCVNSKNAIAKDFLAFVRILRVQCMDLAEINDYIDYYERDTADDMADISGSAMAATYDPIPEEEKPPLATSVTTITSTTQSTYSPVYNGPIVRLCLYGEAIAPVLEIQPTAIDFGCVKIGFEEQRVLLLTNPSSLLPIGFRYKKETNFDIVPGEGFLEPRQSVDVIVTARPTTIGIKEKKLTFHLLEKFEKTIIGQVHFRVKFDSPAITTKRKPQFSLALNPILIKEAGVGVEEVTFKTAIDKPRAAMVQAAKSRLCPWARSPKPPPNISEPEPKFTKSAVSTRKTSKEVKPEYELVTPVSMMEMRKQKEKAIITGYKGTSVLFNKKNCKFTGDSTLANACPTDNELPASAEISGSWVKVSQFTNDTYKFVLDSEKAKPEPEGKPWRVPEKDIGYCKKNLSWNSNALVAFPNERQRSLRQWPQGQLCKAIFSGVERYSCPIDPYNTLLPGEKVFKDWHHEAYVGYNRYTGALHRKRNEMERIFMASKLEFSYPSQEYEISCKKLYMLLGVKPPVEVLPDVDTQLKALSRKKEEKTNKGATFFVPLTPQLLYNVMVSPKAIDFGKVAPGSDTIDTLNMQNLNQFPVKIHVLPGRSGVRLPDGDTVILQPHSQVTMSIIFNADCLGRYNGFMNYVINDNHKFEVTLTADVIRKNLQLATTQVVFGLKSSEDAFQSHFMAVGITNHLQAYTKYHWELPNNTSFTPQPMSGTIPPRRTIMCAINSTPNPHGSQWSDLILRTSESNVYQVLKCSYIPRKPNVVFVKPKLAVPNLPLNMLTTISTLVYNANYEDVMFKILNPEPIYGCEVYPKSGIIKARSFKSLELNFKICAVVEFELIVTLIIQRTVHLDLFVHGNVVYPNVLIKPTTLRLRRISANSFDSLMLNFENKSLANVHIQFPLDEYPEYYMAKLPRRHSSVYGPDGFTLLPGRSQQVFLNFQPEDIATYEFYLPLVINGILGPPILDDNDSQKPQTFLESYERCYKSMANFLRDQIPKKLPLVRVDCTVAGHILSFNKLNFYFELWERGNVASMHQDFHVTNVSRKSVTFCIRTDDLSTNDTPFSIIHVDGIQAEIQPKLILVNLKPEEYIKLRISYRPVDYGSHSAESPIFVRGNIGVGSYNYLKFQGHYRAPTLRTKTPQIFFLPVPLNVESEARVVLCSSYHATETEISAVITPIYNANGEDLSSNAISINFLGGNQVPASLSHFFMHVQLVFRSPKRVAFQTTILFSDTSGAETSVAVTATADNCLLTTHAYLTMQRLARLQEEKEDVVDQPVSPHHVTPSMRDMVAERHPLNQSAPASRDSLSTQESANNVIKSNWFSDRSHGEAVRSVSEYGGLDKEADLKSNILHPEESLEDTAAEFDDTDRGSEESIEDASPARATTTYTYPNFPPEDDRSDYALHMNTCLTATETWVYEQGFKCAFATSIPDGLMLMTSGLVPNTSSGGSGGRDNSFVMKTIIDLLNNIVGPIVHKVFPKLPTPADDVQRVIQTYHTYSQLMDFLVLHRASIIHVMPEYLLNYDDYVMYMTHVWISGPNVLQGCSSGMEGSVKSDSVIARPRRRRDQPSHFPHKLPTVNHREMTHEYDPLCYDCNTIVPKESFALRSKQSWLDVILQIYKAFVLPKITLESYKEVNWWLLRTVKNTSTRTSMYNVVPKISPLNESSRSKVKNITISTSVPGISHMKHVHIQKKLQNGAEPRANHDHSLPEAILLAWLSSHFDLQRTLLWECSSQVTVGVPAPRELTNFDSDLSDALVLVAATASYCPYLVPLYFFDLFPNPETPEEEFHNAVRLAQSWSYVNLGFTVSPSDIVTPNNVFMLMLVTSLYEILPSLFPRETLVFNTGLTMDVTRKIQLTNPSPHRVAYTTKFIGDMSSFFSLERPSNIIFIQSREKKNITLKYQARKICSVRTTLLFCGSTLSPNFAKHLVFTLEGEPITLQTSDSISISAPLCRPKEVFIPIKPPYSAPAEYDIWCTETKPTNTREFTAEPWREMRKRKVPRRLFLSKSRLICNNPTEGPTSLGITVACLAPKARDFYLVFMHHDVGDFIVQLTISARKADTAAPLACFLPPDRATLPCICEATWETREVGTEGCPLRTTIPMPMRNAELWNAVRDMFEKTLDEQERDFWAKHLETIIGLRLIKWLLGGNKDTVSAEFEHIFETSVTYNVVCSAPKVIRVPATFTIPDVRQTTDIDMPVHVTPETPSPYQVTLTLTSLSGKEIRNYKVNFNSPQSSLLSCT